MLHRARAQAVLASHKLERLDYSQLRGVSRLQESIVRAARYVLTGLQRPEQRLSKHIQVHPRSLVRPRPEGAD